MSRFLLKERVGGVQAAVQSPIHPKVPPSVKETSSLSTEQVTHGETKGKLDGQKFIYFNCSFSCQHGGVKKN